MKAALICNPHAGSIDIRSELRVVLDYLARSGWEVTVWETQAVGDATNLARQAARQGMEVAIVAGGDGTINEAVNGLVNTETALGVLPVGTANVWALQMGIPVLPKSGFAKWVADLQRRFDILRPYNQYRTALLAAARVLVKGRRRVIDIGQVNDRYFLMWAGVGFDAEVTGQVSSAEKKLFGPLAFVVPAFGTAMRYKSTVVTLTLDGEARQFDTHFIVVSNIELYGGTLPMGAEARIDDGKLDVCVFKGEGLLSVLQHWFKVASRLHLQDPEIEYCQAQEIIVEAAHPLPVHADDEPFTHTPVTIQTIPGALRVLVPQNAPRSLFKSD